jgi:hypothetical protein
MYRLTRFSILACLLVVVTAAPASAQGKGRKWEYATLYLTVEGGINASSSFVTGKKLIESEAGQNFGQAIFKVYKDLGGKAKEAGLPQLLDLVGQDNWELVSHAATITGMTYSQVWTFKRPAE